MRLNLSITPATFILLFCMIATTPLERLSACLLAALLHELGHIVAAKVLSINLSCMKLDVLGARLTTTGKLYSYPAMITLCAAGPFVNLLCFALTYPLTDSFIWVEEFSYASLSLCLLNLIPVDGFDGGRILHGILSVTLPPNLAGSICTTLSFCSILGLWLISVWLLLRASASLSLFIFSCCLFGMLFVPLKK